LIIVKNSVISYYKGRFKVRRTPVYRVLARNEMKVSPLHDNWESLAYL